MTAPRQDYDAEKCVLIYFDYPAGDTETDELFSAVFATVRYADGWMGDGLLDGEAE